MYDQRGAARNRDNEIYENFEYWKIIFEKKGGVRKDGLRHVLLGGNKSGKIKLTNSTKEVCPNIRDIARNRVRAKNMVNKHLKKAHLLTWSTGWNVLLLRKS